MKATLAFTDDELRALDSALAETLEGVDGNYDEQHVRMEKLRERIRKARLRLRRREAS